MALKIQHIVLMTLSHDVYNLVFMLWFIIERLDMAKQQYKSLLHDIYITSGLYLITSLLSCIRLRSNKITVVYATSLYIHECSVPFSLARTSDEINYFLYCLKKSRHLNDVNMLVPVKMMLPFYNIYKVILV